MFLFISRIESKCCVIILSPWKAMILSENERKGSKKIEKLNFLYLATFHDSFTNYYKYFKRGLKSPNYFLNLSDACCMDPLSLLQFFSEILVFTLLHLLRFHDEATKLIDFLPSSSDKVASPGCWRPLWGSMSYSIFWK